MLFAESVWTAHHTFRTGFPCHAASRPVADSPNTNRPLPTVADVWFAFSSQCKGIPLARDHKRAFGWQPAVLSRCGYRDHTRPDNVTNSSRYQCSRQRRFLLSVGSAGVVQTHDEYSPIFPAFAIGFIPACLLQVSSAIDVLHLHVSDY